MKKYIFILLTSFLPGMATAVTPEEILQIITEQGSVAVLKAENKADLSLENAKNTLQGVEVEFEHLWGREGARKWSVAASQPFEWPGVYGLRKKLVEQKTVAAVESENALCLELKTRATELLVKLAYCQKRIDMTEIMLRDMEQTEHHLEEALNNGLITIIDRKKASIETVMLRVERDKLLNNRNGLVAELSELAGVNLNTNETDWRVLPPIMTLKDFDEYAEKIDKDPSLVALRAKGQYDLLSASEARMSASMPSFALGYKYENEEGFSFNGLTVGVTLPSWGSQKYRKALTASVTANTVAADNLRTVLRNRLENDYAAAQSLRDNLSALHKTGIGGNYMSLVREAVESGEMTLLDYLREQSYYHTTNLSQIDLEEEYALTLARLNRYFL